ncbi:MAG: AmmeMemoRadiSam system protein B [Chloroflexi bacterium B3_Chlor]|nr:MAG: AmmeMemoRadiSam system protein B [Chloroflexi bacterium B3_Chlor]
MKPRLRELEIHFVKQGGQQGILLRDPLRLTDRAIYLPLSLAPLVELCDGTRDEAGLRASLAVRAGVQLGPTTLERILTQLDEALLLDNERFAEAHAAALRDFRTATLRPPVLAGESYPDDVEGLEEAMSGYLGGVDETEPTAEVAEGEIRGLISPHIDYERGGTVYAQVWHKAAAAVREAEIAIIFGTDHMGGDAGLTLTHQRYATPWGTLPTANGIVDKIALQLGPDIVFGDELHHRSEHSIELAVIWLHYFLGDRECELLPVLCGSFDPFVEGEGGPGEDGQISAALNVMREATASRKTVVIAAGDLAHVGPAFGDRYAIDFVERARLRVADEALMASICAGDEEAFFQQVKEERDRRRICGLPPIYMALRFLGDTRGAATGYAQCPADEQGTSFVSICGIAFS